MAGIWSQIEELLISHKTQSNKDNPVLTPLTITHMAEHKHMKTHLHEEASDKCTADVDVVISAGELGAAPWQVEAVHDARQLLPYVIGRHQ